MKDFSNFYEAKETGKKLDFPLEGSHCEMRINLESGKYLLQCSAVQAIILSFVDSMSAESGGNQYSASYK